MIQSILPALSIGDLDACKEITQRGWTSTWTVLHACKEPCHRAALGYTGRGADANHPEYLWAERGEHDLYLNLVDAPDPNFFSVFLLCRALDYLTQKHQAALASNGRTVLVHCNKGHSDLNLVDAPDPNFFSVFLLCRALDYLTQKHQAALASNGRTVLVHCNKGH